MTIAPYSKRVIAVYDPATGDIRFVYRCSQENVATQFVPDGFSSLDVTDTTPGALPASHKVNLDSGQVEEITP